MSFYWRYEHVFSKENITEAKNTTLHYLDPPQTYIAELRKCGLKPIAVYGDFYHAKFEPDSAYFIVLAKAVTEETP